MDGFDLVRLALDIQVGLVPANSPIAVIVLEQFLLVELCVHLLLIDLIEVV